MRFFLLIYACFLLLFLLLRRLLANFWDVVFALFVKADGFRRLLQFFRMIEQIRHRAEERRVVRAGADALIRRDADGQEALHARLPLLHHGNLLHGTHAEEQRNRTEVVDVVVDVMQADGSVVGDIHAGMEGQLVQQCAGAEPVAIKQANQRDDARCQTRHDQHRFRQLIREILLVLAAVGVDDLFHAVAHVVDGVSQVVLHLHRRFAHFGVLRVLEHREGHGAHVPREKLLIEDEAVDFCIECGFANTASGSKLTFSAFDFYAY